MPLNEKDVIEKYLHELDTLKATLRVQLARLESEADVEVYDGEK